MNFNYDYFGLAEPARFYLCKTDNTIICELNGIDLQSVSYTKQLNNFDTIQFDVHRYVNGEESNGYDMLDEAMYIFVDGIGYFRMSYVVKGMQELNSKVTILEKENKRLKQKLNMCN